LREIHEACSQERALAWIALHEPDEEELTSVAREFGLHQLAVEDAVEAHQRPKIERYDGTLFVVLKPARYLDEAEVVEFSEAQVFVGEGFVVTVRHGKVAAFSEVRERLESDPGLSRGGPEAILHVIMDRVVAGYRPVVEGLGNDIEEVEDQVFSGDAGASRRIYQLSREVLEFERATRPLARALQRLTEGDERDAIDSEVRGYLRDVLNNLLRVTEQVEGFRELLSNILNVNLTLISVQQNDQTKKISSWAAILFAPTLVASIYGMNFDRMPELHWFFGYPFALMLMVLTSLTLYAVFKRRGWL
jgi:magnesium transporter